MKLMTKDEAAAALSIGTRTLDRLVADRRIAYVKIGTRLAFTQEDLDAFIETQRVEAEPRMTLRRGTLRQRRNYA